jgi:hypothetical protein
MSLNKYNYEQILELLDSIRNEATALWLVADYPDQPGFGPIARKEMREIAHLLKQIDSGAKRTSEFIAAMRPTPRIDEHHGAGHAAASESQEG